ncbi:hypothetical protein Sj15T_09920 [Sphingobium sp. TA15]|uniref:Uncharacterized protein n=1 Tax=Sphingobium indicum (strain DSM 16413 / CCM 7287 / MTCC 6362 / UT26 / NBRC 101211 / UT26S) TaxID=452662 RepID=D4Z8R2_SPHIU|nr:hypothetical protein [Sphingobium indicum]BAI98994.1 hypothetical protein SJA_P1-00420 [Sphingobium indicum UT26S]BDD65971.1 hypothetical protein Sj15T_09920 [Sphingobium sp. TA15]
MSYDVAFRHRQALDPAALITTTGALHALCAAITDCRNAGKDIETDPAVLLLARHLGSVATDGKPAASDLRRACITEIGEIERNPLLLLLARRFVSYDEAAKRCYHAEGRRVLKRLADALRLERGEYDIHSCVGGPAVAGEISLHSSNLYVMIGIDWPDERRHVLFRRVSSRQDYTGGPNHWASIKEVLSPDIFVERLTRELQLTPPAAAPARLFA